MQSTLSQPAPHSLVEKLAFDSVPSHRRYRLRLARYQAMAEAIAAHLKARYPGCEVDPLKFLDIGPGSGRSLRFLETAGVADRLEFHGIDNDPRRMLSIFEPARWQLTHGDVEKGLPYASEQFEICVCEQVLEHLERPRESVAEMVRVLRPGGLLIVGVPTFPPGVAKLRTMIVSLLDRCIGMKRAHVQSFSSVSFKKLVCGGRPLELIACRGVRVISGGFLSQLEDREWWYQFNRWAGRTFPWLCTEIQLVLRKADAK